MLKILFYCAQEIEYASGRIFLNMAPMYLKTYIDTNTPNLARNLIWIDPQQSRLSDKELIELINKENPDIVCTSHYIWNHGFITDQLSRIRNQVSNNTIFVVGGPSIDVNIDPEFFNKYPFVDYAIYGAGENAFTDLVSSIIDNKKLIAFNTSNIAWLNKEKQSTVIADFKYVPQLQVSPYLHCADMLTRIVKKVKSFGVDAAIPYELTRGCPYSCTFCDWNSGLSNKVTRRKDSYQKEIDLFADLGIKTIFLSDANVGQYEEDIDMIEYFGKVNLERQAGFTLLGNFSKLKKKNNLIIYHAMAKGKLIQKNFNISVQDIHEEILKNINRPDVGWNEHEKMIDELVTAHPGYVAMTQLILGLPGQTVDSWRETLRRVTLKKVFPQVFMNELLPASPAARDKSYQEKFNFKYSTSERVTVIIGKGGNYYRGNFPRSCNSFDEENMVDMVLLTIMYLSLAALKSICIQDNKPINFESVVDKFLNSSRYIELKNNLYTNWNDKDKFYFTKDFDLTEKHVSACSFFEGVMSWITNSEFIKFILSCDLAPEFKRNILSKIKSNEIASEATKLLNEYA